MAKAAIAGFNRIIKKCPHCGDKGPKELVGEGKHLKALCPACNRTFHHLGTGIGRLFVGLIGVLVVIALLYATIAPQGEAPTQPTEEPVASAPVTKPTARAPRAEALSGKDVEAAKQRAISLYPDIGRAGTPMNQEFVRRYQRYLAERPEYFDQPEWPTILARECAAAVPQN